MHAVYPVASTIDPRDDGLSRRQGRDYGCCPYTHCVMAILSALVSIILVCDVLILGIMAQIINNPEARAIVEKLIRIINITCADLKC